MIKIRNIKKISIGDYIVNNGDIAAITIFNSMIRENKNILNKEKIMNETFNKKMFSKKKYISALRTNINIFKKKHTCKKNFSTSITSFYRPDLIFKKAEYE